MTSKDKNTELKILKAAKEVFIIKGFEGSRMQEIADTAGINKSLLHYYFRTKDNLFDQLPVKQKDGEAYSLWQEGLDDRELSKTGYDNLRGL